MAKMTEELHHKVEKSAKQAVREAVERKRVLQQKIESQSTRNTESSTR